MNRETFCDCFILWSVEAKRLSHRRGHVTLERRRAIRAMIRDMLRLAAGD